MKLNLTASVLILALAGSAAFAQGREGHVNGYHAQSHAQSTSTFSTRDRDSGVVVETRRVYGDGSMREEDMEDITVTIYPSNPNRSEIEHSPR